METLFEKNMNYLSKAFPNAFEVMSNYDVNSTSQIQVSTAETKNGLLNIKVQAGANNIFLHSNYDPEREIVTMLSSRNFENKDTLIIFGFGVGYHVEKLINEYPKLNKIIIEPSPEVFFNVINNKDIEAILKAKNVELLLFSDAITISNYMRALYMQGKIYAIDFIELPSYVRLFGDIIKETKEKFAEFLRSFNVNLRTELFCLKDWLNNFFLNLRYVPQSADLNDLAGKFENVPAIMVSAGPSLKKNIDLIRSLSDKALIVANGSTISILQSEGIKPHIVLGIDGNEKMSEIFCKVEWTDIVFAYILNLHHKTMEFYQGPKLYLKSNSEPLVQRMEEAIDHLTSPVAAGGSCANVTMDLLNKLGCNPIIMIGQDLAYTDMELYADGHINKAKGSTLISSQKLKKTKDVYGDEIYTADHLLTMAYTFESYMKSHADKKVFINATEGGLPLAGANNMKLQDAIKMYCDKDLQLKGKLDLLVQESSSTNSDLDSRISDFVLKTQKEAEKIAALSKNRITLINKILKDVKKGKLNEIIPKNVKLNKITKELEQTELFTRGIHPSLYIILLNIKNYYEGSANQTTNQKERLGILNQGLKNQFEIVESVNSFILDGISNLLNNQNREV